PFLPHFALAQDAGSLLRGEVSETAVTNELLGSRVDRAAAALDHQTTGATQGDQGIPAQPYQPASEGATPGQDTDPDAPAEPRSIFADEQNGDQASTRSARLSTAQAREQARKKQNEPEQSASARLTAARKKRTAGATDEAEQETDTVNTTGAVRAPTVDS